jgi:hypothetical protein
LPERLNKPITTAGSFKLIRLKKLIIFDIISSLERLTLPRFRAESKKGGVFLFLVVHRSFKTKRLEVKMPIGTVSLNPGMVTTVINLVFVGWCILVILGQIYKKLDLTEDLSIAILILLIGLRLTLLGMLEQDIAKAFLVVPLASGALRIIRAKMGKWRAAT